MHAIEYHNSRYFKIILYVIYLLRYQFGTVTSGTFRDFFVSYFSDSDTIQILDWDKLLLGRGLPSHPVPSFSNSLSACAISLAELICKYSKVEQVSEWEAIQAVDISVCTCNLLISQ